VPAFNSVHAGKVRVSAKRVGKREKGAKLFLKETLFETIAMQRMTQ
jgi:hypothetical protein